jgi:serine/threonine protein kinase
MIVCPYCATQNPDSNKSCSMCGASLEGAQYPTALRAGTVLQGGKYKIEKVLGQGGFGVTYKAQSTALGIPVVVKEFQPSGSIRVGTSVRPPATYGAKEFAEARVRFADEARVVARLTLATPNAHIVRVYDVFTENDTEYYAMEFLEGKPLQSLVEKGGVLSDTQVLQIARQVVDALKLVHGSNLLHRDIKPDNIMMVQRGAVLIDFGSAREIAGGQRVSIIVTPGYAPLEQYASEARRGPFTDVYALAGTLQFALTGKEPVAATDRASGVKQPTARELNPKVGKPLSDVLERAMKMKVDERPQTAQAFLDMLEQSQGKKPNQAQPTVRVTPPPPPVTQPQQQQRPITPPPYVPQPPANPNQNLPKQPPGGQIWGTPQPTQPPTTPAKPQQQGGDYLWLLYLVCGALIVLGEMRMLPAQAALFGFYGAVLLTAYLILQWLIGTWFGRAVLLILIGLLGAMIFNIIPSPFGNP